MDVEAEVEIFFKAGFDGQSVGACYQSQRVLMLCQLKFSSGVMPKFEAIPVNVSKPPPEFKNLGLHLRVPALFLKSKNKHGPIGNIEPIDIAEDIVLELEKMYPGGVLKNDLEPLAENAVRNFFSKFCYVMRGVSKDFSSFESELSKMDSHLATVSEHFPSANKLFLCGDRPAQIDCEVMPKLHQVRVATNGIKGYELPHDLKFVWRYLHSAYSEHAFVQFCPSDTEILLHWFDTGSGKLSVKQQQLLAAAKGKPPFHSFTVPATATRVIIE